MKSTKILMMLLSFMLVFCTLLALASCGAGTLPPECTEHKDENGDGVCDTEGCGATVEPPVTNTDALNENGELYLFKNGVPTFRFVVGSDALTKHMSTVEELAEILNGLSSEGTEIPVVAYGEEATDVEILVGTVTNRGDEYNVNRYDYGNTGYVVKQIGTKIVVNGGSDTALANAIKYLKEKVFGIKKNNDNFTNFVMTGELAYDVKQTNYSLKELSIVGTSVRDYVLTFPKGDTNASDSAKAIQTALYDNCGIYIAVKQESLAANAKKIAFRTIENDGEGGGFYVSVDKDNNLVIECEYAGKLEKLATDYFKNNVFNKKNSYDIKADLSYAPNLRDIYYSDFGAVGNGTTDDFFAIKAAHDEANEYLLNVHADPNATYYIGSANGNKSIIVKSNTYFHGCKFIFDDEGVNYNSSGRETAIFSIAPDSSATSYKSHATSPIKSLEKGATNVGWKPGRSVMIIIYQSDIRHYIRFGDNASQNPDPMKWGQAQHELLLIDAEGNVDPTTPVQWTYTNVTSMDVYYVDDRPIEVKGEGDNGQHTLVTTWYNDGPNAYFYYYRNFRITRSNVILSGIEHKYEKYVPYSQGGNGCPYNGFTSVNLCNNVTIDNMIYECPPGFKDSDTEIRPSGSPNATYTGMGSYEISAGNAINITWSNSTQSNFFQPDGSIIYDGSMGTNFCRNLTFDNMFTCSFDAHCGVYNATIKNSTLEHLNFIGDGLIKYENVTVYADANRAAVNLREDYGATWAGNIEIDGLTFKVKQGDAKDLYIVKSFWNNWNFGYTTYLPQNFILKNVLVAQYTYELKGNGNGTDNRIEGKTYVYNERPVRVFMGSINEAQNDISAATVNGEENKNPMVASKTIKLYTAYTGKYAELGITKPLNFIFPAKTYNTGNGIIGSTMFKNSEYYIDDVLQ